jgi:hypothetical protein
LILASLLERRNAVFPGNAKLVALAVRLTIDCTCDDVAMENCQVRVISSHRWIADDPRIPELPSISQQKKSFVHSQTQYKSLD